MYVKTAERTSELAHLMHLQKIFHRKELNATKDDWFLMHSISILPKS